MELRHESVVQKWQKPREAASLLMGCDLNNMDNITTGCKAVAQLGNESVKLTSS